MANTSQEHELQQETRLFRARFNSVLLSTSNLDATPDASYAPFILNEDGQVIIFISQLAQHTRNLCSNPRADLMWIENESESRNYFARKRLILQCSAREVARDSENGRQIVEQMQQEHGKTIEVLRNLPDFKLFAFDVIQGNYIRGFAQAWQVKGNNLQIIELR